MTTFHTASFKDRDAQVVIKNNEVYRLIYDFYKEPYEKLMQSGLYEMLISKKMLIPHIETENFEPVYKTLKPQKVFVSYPYEWCFSELKDAALLTLEIQKLALEYGMSLKDANAYNVQFFEGKPIFIDTSSFEIYEETKPWSAYRQFCMQFLAPLAVMAYKDERLVSLLETNLDGLPLDIASKLLPKSSWLNLKLLSHVHLHALAQKNYSGCHKKIEVKFSKFQMEALLNDLTECIKNIKLPKSKTEWGNYYNETNYSDESFEQKRKIVNVFGEKINPETVVDFGANNGAFSRLFKEKSKLIVSADIDFSAVEQNYAITKKEKETNILPLVLDLCNPSASVGWANEERSSFFERIKDSELVLALALVHHLAIGRNVPFSKIAKLFSSAGKNLIVEYVDKKDSQVEKLLSNRKDIFDDYSIENFEKSFGGFFDIVEKRHIDNTFRTIYLMRRKEK